MNNLVKNVVYSGISFRQGEFKNDGSMVRKLPDELKNQILNYLKAPEPALIGDVRLIDPVTGNCYNRTNIIRQKDGFEWSSAVIYMLEHYDIRLSDEFLKMFKQ